MLQQFMFKIEYMISQYNFIKQRLWDWQFAVKDSTIKLDMQFIATLVKTTPVAWYSKWVKKSMTFVSLWILNVMLS